MVFLITLNLKAISDSNISSLGFEALFLKIASESFFSEYEANKELLYLNQDKIERLEYNFEQINEYLKRLSTIKQKLNSEYEDMKKLKSSLISIVKELSKDEIDLNLLNNSEMESLKLEIESLKSQIQTLKSLKQEPLSIEREDNIIYKRESQESNSTTKLKLISKSANIRETPFLTSEVLDTLNRDEIIVVDRCDKYGWCKLRDRDGYIPKYLFLEIE